MESGLTMSSVFKSVLSERNVRRQEMEDLVALVPLNYLGRSLFYPGFFFDRGSVRDRCVYARVQNSCRGCI